VLRKWLFLIVILFGVGEGAALYGAAAFLKSRGLCLGLIAALTTAGLFQAKRQSYRAAACCFCLLGLVSGWILTDRALSQSEALRSFTGQEVMLTGRIEPESVKLKEDGTALVLKAERLKLLKSLGAGITVGGKLEADRENKNAQEGASTVTGLEYQVSGRVRIFIKKQNSLAKPGENYEGGTLVVKGLLNPLVFLANPGSPDGERAARISGLAGRMSVKPAAVQVLPGRIGWSEWLQVRVRQLRLQMLQLLPARQGGVLLGMVLGGSADLDPETADLFRDNGLAHLLAVSGTHVALLLTALAFLLRELPTAGRNVLLMLFLIFYSAICGWQPAVIRASLMSCVLLWTRVVPLAEVQTGPAQKPQEPWVDLAAAASKGEITPGKLKTLKAALAERRHKKLDGGSLLLLTGLAMLLFKPLWLFSAGFQLSFLTMGGIIFLQPKVLNFLPDGWPGILRESLALTLTAQLLTLPVVVSYFHRFAMVAVLSNLILLPALSLAVIIFAAGLVLYILWPGLSAWVMGPALFLVRGSLQAGSWLLQMPGAACDVAQWGWLRLLSYYLVLLLFLDAGPAARLSKRPRRLLMLGGSLIFGLVWAWQCFWPRPLTVHILDVGQGDAALVQTREGKNILIDTGGLPGDYEVGRQIVLPYLRYLGVKRLHVLILSHGDHDHAGGAAAIARALPVDNVFLGGGKPSGDVKNLLAVLPTAAKVQQVETCLTYGLGASRLEFLTGEEPFGTLAKGNDSSLIVKLTEGGQSLLFTGDASEELERRLSKLDLQADLLKVGHHGSGSSSSEAFLRQVKPKLATISVGKGNTYGHPAPETLGRLRESGALVLRTDVLGAVKVVFDADRFTWYSYRYQSNKF